MTWSSDKPTLKLLVIEDERDAASYLKGYFEGLGLEVVTASNGEEGLLLISSAKPRLILLDLRLGHGIDGLEVLEKAQGSGSEILVITAVGDPNVLERARGLGASECITKPFVLEDLGRAVLNRLRG